MTTVPEVRTGLLADAIARALPNSSVHVVATDSWDTSGYEQARERSAMLDRTWLPVRTELGTVVIGPAERHGIPGCVRCADGRRRRAQANGAHRAAVRARYGPLLADRPSALLTALAVDTVTALVVDEVARLESGGARTRNAVLLVDLTRLTVARHPFLPDPLCAVCGNLPDDSAEAAEITLLPRPKVVPDSYRVRAVLDELDDLVQTYVDDETGLIRSLHRDTQGGLVIAGAMIPIRSHEVDEPGVGRGRSYRASELTAILEALERYGGTEPGGRRTVVRASFAELGDTALDPRTLGTHPEESYAQQSFPYQEFDPDRPYRWVWGHSFARGGPVLVPEAMAYYYLVNQESRPFSYEISNGCALGSCLEEAILYGLLEAIERDAFLMTWYGRLPVPRIDLSTAGERAICLQAAAITVETGYEVHAFDTTMEHGVPSTWVMAVNPDDTDPRPKLICAAGAHLSLERAVLNGLSELGPILADFLRRFPADAERAELMARDPNLVTTMHDHSVLYGSRTVAHRLDFLLGTTTTRSLSTPGHAFRSPDLTADLRELVGRYLATGNDVVVVDQTATEHQAGGFRCVKVLVAGLAPMTFGHRFRRTRNLPRLLTVPQRLGYWPRPLLPDELNTDPHPFP